MPARLSEAPFVHETAEVENSTLGRYTESPNAAASAKPGWATIPI